MKGFLHAPSNTQDTDESLYTPEKYCLSSDFSGACLNCSTNEKGRKVQTKLLLRPQADNGVYGWNFYMVFTFRNRSWIGVCYFDILAREE